jgi:hippurate hydrolase
LGKENVDDPEPTMGAEDFSLYGRAGVPACIFWLGTIDAKRLDRMKQLGQEPPSLHSSLFWPDADETLVTGITATVAAALELLKSN